MGRRGVIWEGLGPGLRPAWAHRGIGDVGHQAQGANREECRLLQIYLPGGLRPPGPLLNLSGDPSKPVRVAISFNLPHRMVQMDGYGAGNDLGSFNLSVRYFFFGHWAN